METTIRSIFLGKQGKTAHDEFIKFSKGEFKDKYMVEAKRQKESWNIKTTSEYVNALVRLCLENTNKDVAVKGVIVSTLDLRKDLNIPLSGMKQFMGIKQFVVDASFKPKELIEAIDKNPRAFFALSFKTEDSELKVKPKAPKSAKPAAGGDKGPKVDFCSLKTTNSKIAEEILFDLPDFKQASISHDLIINEIEIPKNVKDPVQMREQSIRKGKIRRRVVVDEKPIVSEANFSA